MKTVFHWKELAITFLFVLAASIAWSLTVNLIGHEFALSKGATGFISIFGMVVGAAVFFWRGSRVDHWHFEWKRS